MTEKEIRARSQEKVNQVLGLMKTLYIEPVIKKRITSERFIEDVIVYRDNEKYDLTQEPAVEKPTDPEQAPKEESNEKPTE